jgi:DNA topoisomerase-2
LISIANDGDGISSAVHAATQIYASTRFGQPDSLPTMMTPGADHWRNERNRKQGVQHFSKEFRIETVDHELKKLYKQTWTENMSICHPPKIACKNLPIHASHSYPTYARFGMETLDLI